MQSLRFFAEVRQEFSHNSVPNPPPGNNKPRLISAVSVVKHRLPIFFDVDAHGVEGIRKRCLPVFCCRRKPRRSKTRRGGRSSDDRNRRAFWFFQTIHRSFSTQTDVPSVSPNANTLSTKDLINQSLVKTAFSREKQKKIVLTGKKK